MRVPDYMLQCVGFVAECEDSDAAGESFDPVATGFFISVPSQVNPTISYVVFVTARHVAKDLQNRTTVLLMNQPDGGIAPNTDYGNAWYLHPDDSVDVAVLPLNIDLARHKIKAIPIEMFLDESKMLDNGIGIGDEVYFPGLFGFALGQKFTPILRHGNIAMLSREPIQVEGGFAEVHLIEARSIGGISGSPVFVRGTVNVGQAPKFLHGLSGTTHLLGLIHGHWDIRESDLNNPRFTHASLHGVNVGIAVVVPAHKILETLYHPELLRMWAERDREYRGDKP